jgi:broad specificity phosphatase PhoE
MRALAIPVGRVYSSPYCRAVETAEALGLGQVETTVDVMNLRVADHFGGREAIVATARKRLAGSPAPGRNDVYVAHGNVARAATSVYPGEGEALVFMPRGDGGFDFVGRLSPNAWQRLAGIAN